MHLMFSFPSWLHRCYTFNHYLSKSSSPHIHPLQTAFRLLGWRLSRHPPALPLKSLSCPSRRSTPAHLHIHRDVVLMRRVRLDDPPVQNPHSHTAGACGILDRSLRTFEQIILLPDVIIMDDAARFYGAGDAVTKDSKYPEIKPASIPTAIPTMNSLVDINLFCDLISCILLSSIVSINS